MDVNAGTVLAERYEIVRGLGRGGAGELLLVRDRRRANERCALKVLRPRVADPGLVPLFRNEFLLLSDVHHPCIVGVKDFGQLESGEPFFTMDYVAGQNCRSFVESDQLEAHEYVELAAGVLGALAHMHASGIVHRDVKPENVIMRRGDGHLLPALIDFGLAMMSAATRSGEATGTLPYIAPEILAGAAADPRSDLFSVGMLLFEVCTGKPPAARQELLSEPSRTLAPDRIRRRLNQSARGSVPRRFEEFLPRLIAPSPTGRFPSAAEALHFLADLYGEDAVGAPIDVVVRPLASEAPLVGRGPALASMMMRVAALQEGTLLEPTVVVAGGEGVGVTRLLATVRNHASVSGCVVFSGRDLRGLAREVTASDPPGAENPEGLVFRVDAALHAMASTEFPVVVLDDVHRLGDAECSALRHWVTAIEARPGRARMLLVLGGRNEGDRPGVQLLKTAGNAVPVELRNLAPLTPADVRGALSMVGGGVNVPTEVANTIHRASDGNPRMLGELIRLLLDEGILPELDPKRLSALDVPAGILDTARRRFAGLDKDTRGLLGRLALVQRPLAHAAAYAIAGDHMVDLLAAGYLLRDHGRIGFPHEAWRAAADALEGEARTAALGDVAQALAEPDPAAAAQLWREAGDDDAAREVGVPAAAELLRSGRFERARALLEDLAPERPTGELGALLLRARYRSGRTDSAARLGRLLMQDSDDIDILMTTVSALRDSSQPEAALKLLEGLDGPRVTNGRAALLLAMGRLDEALEASRRAEEAQGSLLDTRGAVARVRSTILREAGHRNAARGVEDAIIAAGDKVAPGVYAAALLNRALFALEDGDAIRGARLARRSLAMRDTGSWATGRPLAVLGKAMMAVGRPARAAKLFAAAKERFVIAALQPEVAQTLKDEALALLACGRPVEADQRLERAAGLPGLPESERQHRPAATERAHLAGDQVEALARCEERAVAGVHGAAEAALQAARIVAAMGDPDAAEESWRRALTLAWQERRRDLVVRVRVGWAELHGKRGAWRLATRTLDRNRSPLLTLKSALATRALVVRAAAALSRGEPAAAGRRMEQAVATANRTGSAPLIAEVYTAAASLLEEGAVQRHLRRPTSEASAVLLEAAREIWAIYGNETMLRTIDLHLSELPRAASSPFGGPDSDRLVKVLHIAREMNQQFDRDRLLGLILDRAVELTGAERGFVILLKEGRTDVHIARNIDRESLSEPEHKVSSQIISEVVRTGRIVRSEDAELDERFEEFLSVRQMHLKSIVAVPFRAGGKTVGALYLDNRFKTGNFGESEERLLELFADQAVAAIDKAEMIRELKAKNGEIEGLNKQLKLEVKQQGKELRSARREIKRHRSARGYTFDKVIARSVSMQAVLREAKRFSASDLSVLLVGENGTGKELLAKTMHYESKRQSMPCLALNCAGYPDSLEAELFGHVRGSVTGADRDRPGIFEESDGGTLILDEIGSLDQAMQVRLLRALESGEVRRVGDSQSRTVDVRVIAANRENLEEHVRNGRFREDLYYRISGFVLKVPPLRERLEDVEPLAYAFVEEAARREGRPNLEIANEAIARLESYTWSGNVRELRSVVFRAAVTAENDVILPDDVSVEARSPTLLPGFDPSQADQLVQDLASRGIDLNERQQSAIARVLGRGKLSFGEYQKLFRVSKSTTARDLEGLLELELLEKRGKTRAVVYLPGAKLRELAKKSGRA